MLRCVLFIMQAVGRGVCRRRNADFGAHSLWRRQDWRQKVVGRREPLTSFPTIVQWDLHSCFQAEGHLRSSRSLHGELWRQGRKDTFPGQEKPILFTWELYPWESWKDNGQGHFEIWSTGLKPFWFLIFLKGPYPKLLFWRRVDVLVPNTTGKSPWGRRAAQGGSQGHHFLELDLLLLENQTTLASACVPFLRFSP